MKNNNISKKCSINDGNRTLFESMVSNDVLSTIKRLPKNDNMVFIGGIASSYYIKPRYTDDIDILFSSKGEIPTYIKGFRIHEKGFIDNKNGVVLHIHTTETIKLDIDNFKVLFESCIISDGIKIPSLSGLILTRLNRYSNNDISNIFELLKCGKVSFRKFKMTSENHDNFNGSYNSFKLFRQKQRKEFNKNEKLEKKLSEVHINILKTISLLDNIKKNTNNYYIKSDVVNMIDYSDKIKYLLCNNIIACNDIKELIKNENII